MKKSIIKKYKALVKLTTMLDIKLLMVLQIAFGQYNAVTSSKITSLLLRLYCLGTFVVALHVSISYSYFLQETQIKAFVFNSAFVFHYIATIVISQISSPFLSTFTNLVISSDLHMGYKKKAFCSRTIFIYLVLHLCISALSLLCDLNLSKFWQETISSDINNLVYLASHHFIHVSLVLSDLNTIAVLGLLLSRLKTLRKTLNASKVPVNIAGKAEIKSKLKVLRKCLENYGNLLDAFRNVHDSIQFRIFVLISFCLPMLTFYGYNILQQLSFEPFQRRMSRIYYVDFASLLVQMTTHCMLSELCRGETNDLKTVLTDKIFRCADEELREELLRSLEYVSRRPFTLTLLNMNVDVRLPLNLIAFSITYVVLIIDQTQFVY